MDSDEETAFMGLTDIISNLMVLFILLTVFVLTIKLSEASQDNSATGNNGRVGGEFINGLNSELYGTVTTFVVMENGFGQLNWGAVATHIAGQETIVDLLPFQTSIYIVRGDGEPLPNDQTPTVKPPRDKDGGPNIIDGYRFSLSLGEAIPEWAVIPPDTENITDMLLTSAPAGSALSFIVYPEAVASFVPVYEALIEQGVCFRWVPWDAKSNYLRTSVSYAGQNRCPT